MAVLLVAERDGTVRCQVELDRRRKLTIGRSHRCDLRLTPRAISRRHALLFEHAGEWHLVDTGSRTGVYSGPERVRHFKFDADQWARLGPAYLWLDGQPQASIKASMSRPIVPPGSDSAE